MNGLWLLLSSDPTCVKCTYRKEASRRFSLPVDGVFAGGIVFESRLDADVTAFGGAALEENNDD